MRKATIKIEALIRRARNGGTAARQELIQLFRPAAILRAKSFKARHPEAELADLIGYADLGLVKAMDRLIGSDDGRRDFLLLAIDRVIAHEHERFIGREPEIGGNVLKKILRRYAREMDGKQKGKASSEAPLPSPRRVVTPFDSLLEGLKLLPEEVLSQDWARWKALIAELRERDRDALVWRHGIAGREPMTLELVGERFGFGKERARQILQRAYSRLRKSAAACGLIDPKALPRIDPLLLPDDTSEAEPLR